jgi:hypothetical protein
MKRIIRLLCFSIIGSSLCSCTKYEFEDPTSGSKTITSIRENSIALENDEIDKVTEEESNEILNVEGTKLVR